MGISDKFNKMDKKLDKLDKSTEKQIVKEYKESMKVMNFHLSELYRKYDKGQGLKASEIHKLGRYEALMKEVNREMFLLTKKKEEIISRDLSQVYSNSYIYSVEAIEQTIGQTFGIPIVNPEIVQASVQNPISGLTLSERLEADRTAITATLKGTITQGLIQAKSYGELSKDIQMNLSFSAEKSKRIARTEANRVRNEARQKSYEYSAEKGVFEKKQWLSADDSRTRKTHSKLDGVVIGVNEEFENGRYKATHPGGFGVAEEDINCRCRVIPYFDDAEEDEEEIEEEVKVKEIKKEKTKKKFIPVKTVEEAEKYAINSLGLKKVDYKDYPLELGNEFNRTLTDLLGKYPILEALESVGPDMLGHGDSIGVYSGREKIIGLNTKFHLGLEQAAKENKKLKEQKWTVGEAANATLVHEFGHAVDKFLSVNGQDVLKQRKRFRERLRASEDIYMEVMQNVSGRNKKDLVNEHLGRYATSKKSEFFAEAFNDYYENGKNASPIGIEFGKVLERRMKEALEFQKNKGGSQ